MGIGALGQKRVGSNNDCFLATFISRLFVLRHWSSAKVLDVDPRGGISAGTLHAQIKRFFTDCADVMALTDPRSAERFGEASIHWLRHTHGTHAVETGMPLDVVQQNMGHASTPRPFT